MRVALLVLLIGLVAWGAGYWQGLRTGRATAPPPVARVEPQAPAVQPAPAPPPVSLAVEVLGPQGRRAGRVTGVALGEHHRVLIPLAALDGAQAALAETPDGRLPLGAVVGVLPAARVAALAGPEGALPVATDPASLHLGLTVRALEPGRAIAGEVQSTGERRGDGSYFYGVRLAEPLSFPFAALVSEDGATLVGLVTRAGAEPDTYEAVDAGALLALADGISPASSIGSFAREFFSDQATGRLIALEHAAAAGKWLDAIQIGRGLVDLGWTWSEAVTPLLDQAYLEAARAARDQPEAAIALLDEAARVLGESSQRLRERADLLAALGRPIPSLAALGAAAARDAGLRADYRAQVLAIAERDSLARDARIAAVRDALAQDPGYASYHAALGRLYYAAGRYAEAAAALERAVALDPSLLAASEDMLASARQRIATPGETLVPLHASDSGLYVFVNIGGRQMRFVVDTGATYTALSAQAARSIGIVGYAQAPHVQLMTAGGRLDAPLVTLRSLDLNGALLHEVPVVVLDTTAPFDGLLGMSFLEHFDVNIDRGAGYIRLVRR
jgi:clan AA aspartic protease (TIGR02281 family)